jgi:hypothetical protein
VTVTVVDGICLIEVGRAHRAGDEPCVFAGRHLRDGVEGPGRCGRGAEAQLPGQGQQIAARDLEIFGERHGRDYRTHSANGTSQPGRAPGVERAVVGQYRGRA